MSIDENEIRDIIDFLKEGLINTYSDGSFTEGFIESTDDFDPECDFSAQTTPLSMDSSTEESIESIEDFDREYDLNSSVPFYLNTQPWIYENDVPFMQEEWLIFDAVLGRYRPPRLLEYVHLLLGKSHYRSYASYKDIRARIFKIHKPDEVAALWERVKARKSSHRMDYNKFARALRWHYKTGAMIKTKTRYTFQFAFQKYGLSLYHENNDIW